MSNDIKTIYRISKDPANPYVMLDKRPLNDAALSWKAKGIWAYLMSKPDDWMVIIEDIIKHSTDGVRAVRSGIKELEDAGYIVSVQERDEDGRFDKKIWNVYEAPYMGVSASTKRTDGEQSTVNTFSANGKPASGKKHTTNKELTNKDTTNKENNNSIPKDELTSYIYLLAEITGQDKNLINWGWYSKEAKKLHDAGYSLEVIANIYNRDGAWYKEDWRGKKGQKPTIKQIRETIKELAKKSDKKQEWIFNEELMTYERV